MGGGIWCANRCPNFVICPFFFCFISFSVFLVCVWLFLCLSSCIRCFLFLFCQVFQLKFNLIYCYKLSLFIYCPPGNVPRPRVRGNRDRCSSKSNLVLAKCFREAAAMGLEPDWSGLSPASCFLSPGFLPHTFCIFCNFSNDVYQIIQFGFHTKHFLCEMAKGPHKAEGVGVRFHVKWQVQTFAHSHTHTSIQIYVHIYNIYIYMGCHCWPTKPKLNFFSLVD